MSPIALTYKDIRQQTLKLLDEVNTAGTIQTTGDYTTKIQDLINQAMVDLASTTAKIHGEYYIEQAPIENEISKDTSSIKIHLPGNDFSISLTNAKSTFFECTGPATVIIEESADGGATYSNIETITVTATDFAEYKRLISPGAATNLVRLRFTGDYVFRFRNYILYPYTFPTEAEIQQNRPHFLYDMPTDFMSLEYVMIRRDARQYLPYSSYILRSDKKMAINRYDVGEFLIHYWRNPTFFTFTGVEATDDAQVFGIDATNSIYRVADDAALIIPYYAAGNAKLSESDLTNGITLLNIFEQKKVNLVTNSIGYQGSVISVSEW